MLELARLARREVETTTRLLGVLEARGWIAKLDPDLHSERWVLIANPRHIDLLAVFNALVIDRKELEYQVRLSTTPFDGESLLAALDARRFDVSLAEVLGSPRPRRADEPEKVALGAAQG